MLLLVLKCIKSNFRENKDDNLFTKFQTKLLKMKQQKDLILIRNIRLLCLRATKPKFGTVPL